MRRTSAVVAGAVLALAACSGDDGAARGDDGRLRSAGDVDVFELQEGDCLVPPDEVTADVQSVQGVPCDEEHTQEVFAIVEYEAPEGASADTFPGNDVLVAYAEAACLDPFATYVGIDYVDSALFLTHLVPTLRSWDEGDDREIVCIAQSDGTPLTDSVEGSGA